MTRLLFTFVLLMGLPALTGAQPQDSRAVALSQSMVQSMGGDGFHEPRYLLFQFVVERDGESLADYSHAWDRETGDYRITGTTREGEAFVTLFNIQDQSTGRAWVGDRALEGEELAEAVSRGYQRFINDSYWLLMPWKWQDPGVNLEFVETRSMDGSAYDVVQLTFDDGTGLTSGDTYWGYVSRDTRLMERWSYILQDSEATEPSMWTWEDWKDGGNGVVFSTRKHNAERNLDIVFPQATLTDTVPASLFSGK